MIIQKKRIQQQKINDQIQETNRNAILLIEQRKAKEKEQEEKISQYIKDKADKEAELQAEQR